MAALGALLGPAAGVQRGGAFGMGAMFGGLGIIAAIAGLIVWHGFATYLAEEGANPAAIQILLGHESLDTTTRYVHASDKYAEETHKKYHPLSD